MIVAIFHDVCRQQTDGPLNKSAAEQRASDCLQFLLFPEIAKSCCLSICLSFPLSEQSLGLLETKREPRVEL